MQSWVPGAGLGLIQQQWGALKALEQRKIIGAIGFVFLSWAPCESLGRQLEVLVCARG